jgi:transcriptional regulator with XRE-family HTH domain
VNAGRGDSLDIERLGHRLRDLRSAHELSLDSLAKECGISPSLLSQVERGKVTPSLATLHTLSRALNTPMFELFGSPRNRLALTTPENRRSLRPPGAEGVTYQMVSTSLLTNLQMIEMHIDAESGNFDHSLSHPGDECAIVLEGRALIEIEGEELELGPGDAVSFMARLSHRFSASGGPTRLLVAMTPPAF